MTDPASSAVPAVQRPTPVARFLGDQEAAGGPFAILRVLPGPLSDDEIIAALDGQLARLAGHRECNTPQADEVRLALHAAAAQLLDPRVRAHLIARWGGEAAPGQPPVAEPFVERRRFPRAPSPHVALEHDAVLTLGMFGGWNGRSLQRLMALSAARGLSPDELADALRGLGGGVRRAVPESPATQKRPGPLLTRLATPLTPAPADAAEASRHSAPLPEEIDPAERILKIVLLCGGAFVLLLMLALGVLVLAAKQAAVAGTPSDSPSKLGGTAAPTPIAASPDVPPPAPPPEELPDIDLVTRELSASVSGFAPDPAGAVGRFEAAVRALADGWPALAPDQMVAAQHQVIEFVYRAAPMADVASRAVAAVAAGAEALGSSGPMAPSRIRAAVWSVGMLNRLAKENDLPSAVEQMIDARLAAALGSRRPGDDRSFEAGAAAAVQAIPSMLAAPGAGLAVAPDPSQVSGLIESWRGWMGAAEHVASDAGSRDRLLLGGLQTVLVEGPDPSADEATFRVVRLIVARLTWRPGEESREWLLQWFDDERITSADLYAVTSALATSSSAEHVNATMVVPVLASGSVRSEMRDSYARAWGITGGADRADIVQQVFEAADMALARDDPKRPLAEVLGSAVVLSRLNEAASWAWRGQIERSQVILGSLEQGVVVSTPTPQSRPGIRQFDPQSRPANREWSEKYLAAKKNIQLRLDLIGRLSNEGQLDAAGAELLVGDALRGNPAEVRRAAAEKVLRFADVPLVVNGVLEELPTVPATLSNLRLIEAVGLCRLSGPGDPGWTMTARRALSERLLQLVASEGDLAVIDRESELLARSFEGRILEAPPTSSVSGPLAPSPAADLSAAFLYRQWRSKVDPALPPPPGLAAPDEIERRRAGRAALARGMIQGFAAQQVSACELMAFVVGAERPADVSRIAAVLGELVGQRQRAGHIFEQIRATEGATLRLWLIRLGQEPQS